MRNLLFLVLVFLLMSACAPKMVWKHDDPNITPIDLKRDVAKCDYESNIYAGPYPYIAAQYDFGAAGWAYVARKNQLFEQCMIVKGFFRAPEK